MTFGEQAADVGMSIPRGLSRGAVQATGMLGDIGQLTDVAGPLYQRYIGSRIQGMDRSAAERQFQDAMRVVQERQTPEERAGTQGRLFGTSFTTGAGRMEQARPFVPFGLMEESKTPLGRMISSTGEFIGGAAPLAVVTGGVGGAAPALVRGALSEAVGAGARGAISSAARHSLAPSNVMAGLGSGVAGEYASDLLGEGGARFTGAVAGALAPSAASRVGRAVGATPAEQQLAESIRRSSTGPGLSRQEFEAARQQGLPVTLADVRGVGGIYQRALGHAGEAGIPAADALRARAGNSLYTVTDTASDLGSTPMRSGVPGQSVDFDIAREAAQKEADEVLKPAYAQLRANRADMWSPELEVVLNNPVGMQAAQAAISQIAARNRTNPISPFTVQNNRVTRSIVDGNVVPADPEFWDAIKQQLQTIAFSERAHHSTAEDLRRIVRTSLNSIDNYDDIMKNAQRFITGRNAFEAGNNVLNLPTQRLQRQLHEFNNTFTSLDRETFARGVLSAIFDDPRKARNIFNVTDNRALNQWRTVLDEVSPGAFDQMRRATQVSSIIESVGNLRAREPDALNRFLRQATTMAGGAAAGAALASRVMPSIEGTAIGAIAGAATLPIISKVVSASRDRTSRSILEILSGNAPDKERLVMQILNENPSSIGRVSELARALAQWNTHVQAHSQETQQRLATIPDVHVTAPRPTRASGGRITSHHRAKAQALINAADRAKKAHNGTTKPILDMPDETVAKALSLADQAI
jgi:hypothetical protein